ALVVVRVEALLRGLHGLLDRAQALGEILRWLRARPFRETRQARVDAVEERRLVLLHLRRQRRFDELVGRRRRGRGQREQLSHTLALVHAACFGADVGVRLPEQRVVDTSVYSGEVTLGQLLAGEAEPCELIELLRLPGAEAVLDLIGIFRR